MIAVQIGAIIFLLFVLLIIYRDEFKRIRLSRKSAKLNRFWTSTHPPSGKERRKSVRINTELDVLYEVASGKAVQRRASSKSRNISVGGINLALNEKLFPGTILKLQLNIPESPRPIFIEGKIVWVKEISEKFTKNKEERFFVTGIQFIQINPHDETFLRNFIIQRIKNAPEQVTPFAP